MIPKLIVLYFRGVRHEKALEKYKSFVHARIKEHREPHFVTFKVESLVDTYGRFAVIPSRVGVLSRGLRATTTAGSDYP